MISTNKEIYVSNFKKALVFSLVQVAIGILLFFLPLENAIDVFMVIFGIYLILIGIMRILFSLNNKTIYGRYIFASSIIYLVLGIMICFFSNMTINIIVAVFLIVLPIIRIILSQNKKQSFKDELFTMVVGIFVLLFGISSVVKVLRYVAGTIVILFAIFNFIMAFLNYRKARQSDNVFDANVKELN